ncbi:hypothetical protein AB2L28_09890 [Kineococcus sp. TBRC 1896]|uniref:Uncharacterized protein n=1 Tax=Kineococcus mangrovi TaxID=1660183 RepID=A0ABV4I1J8_9ACTN
MFREPGLTGLFALGIPLVLWAVGLAVTAYVVYRAVRAGVRDGIRSAREDRGPGTDPLR